jgi:hypothetical protein
VEAVELKPNNWRSVNDTAFSLFAGVKIKMPTLERRQKGICVSSTSSNPQGNSPSRTNARRPFIPAVWRQGLIRDLKGAPLSVYLAYCSHADKQGLAWPSVGALIKTTGYGRNTTKDARSELVKMGLLIPLKQARKSGKFCQKVFRVAFTVGQKEYHGTVAPLTVARPSVARPAVGHKGCQEGSPSQGSPIQREDRESEGSASPNRKAPAPIRNSAKQEKSYSVDGEFYV